MDHKKTICACTNLFLFSFFLWSNHVYALKPLIPSARDILSLPDENRQRILSKNSLDPAEISSLIFDTQASLELRWRGLLALASLPYETAKPHLEKALSSNDWMLRNGGLLALRKLSPEQAIRQAERFMSDPALVVRTAAVETIRELKARPLKPLLWEKLYAKENFRGNHSLWIRRHIAETLSVMGTSDETPKFIKILLDDDTSLYPSALSALERISNVPVAEQNDPPSEKRKRWLRWWNAQTTVSKRLSVDP